MEGNWVDYGRGLCIAEEAVHATIDQRLVGGVTKWWLTISFSES